MRGLDRILPGGQTENGENGLMALNYIFIGFFLVSFIASIVQFFVGGDYEVFSRLVNPLL